MRIEKINEHQVRCLISLTDLQKRQLTAGELRYGDPGTSALFKEVLQAAQNQYGFNKEEYPVMIEAVPVKDGLLIILSAVENPEETDPHFVQFHEEDGEEEASQEDAFFNVPEAMPDIRHAVFHFTGIDEAVIFARRLGEYEGESFLYRGEQKHEFFMLLTRPKEMKSDEFCTVVNQVAEFAEGIIGDPIFAAKLLEHDVPALTDAVNILRRM